MKWFKFFPALFLVVAACAGFPFFGKAASAGNEVDAATEVEKEPGRITLELQGVHYDGETLSGRLLIGVTEGHLRLDKRLFSGIDAEIKYPRDCRTGQGAPHIIADGFPPRGRKEDLLVLERGYWYGKEIGFPLFDEHFTGLGPECLKAELWLFSFDGRIAARTEIRAERPPRPSMDAGTPEAPMDMGVPEDPSDGGTVEVNFTERRAGP